MHIGRYEVISPLGAGGMSEVLLARSEQSGQLVVLKRQHHHAEDAALVDEARIGLRLNHPSIVETLDLFYHEERPVLVVAFVQGATLSALRANGPLPVGMCCRIGKEIAEALDCIHNAREEDGRPLEMLHRDVTPANIMVGRDGHARLIDLGIARSAVNQAARTQEGMIKGTLRYLAPELLQTGVYTRATDLWGLGLSLWEAALGRNALEGDDITVFRKICDGKAMALLPGENVDPRIRHAVGQLLSLAPECRPVTADAAALVFNQYLAMFSDTDEVCRAQVELAAGPEKPFDPEKSETVDARALIENASRTFTGKVLREGLSDLNASGSTPPPVIFDDDPLRPQPTEVILPPSPSSALSPAPTEVISTSAGTSGLTPKPTEIISAFGFSPPSEPASQTPPRTQMVSQADILSDVEAHDFEHSDSGATERPFSHAPDPFDDPEKTEVIDVDAMKATQRAEDTARRLGLRQRDASDEDRSHDL